MNRLEAMGVAVASCQWAKSETIALILEHALIKPLTPLLVYDARMYFVTK
ncbi:MAG: hypothetical protein LRY73_15825 [Bacillus sp. (in: Bacteria)]|nr:hypothetical protein [Bacillus sp. (in: firmicutes)]